MGARRSRPDATPDDPGTTFADRTAAERRVPRLARPDAGRRARQPGGRRQPVQLGIPGSTSYTFDGAIATVLGPRDDAWLESAVADTRVAIDITPWWADATDRPDAAEPGAGAHVARRPLAHAGDQGGARAPREVHRILSRAYPTEPTLAYPWRAWAEVIGMRASTIRCPARSSPGPSATPAPARRSATAAPRSPSATRAGRCEIPGSYAERRPPEEWWGGGAGRNITLAAVQTATAAAR